MNAPVRPAAGLEPDLETIQAWLTDLAQAARAAAEDAMLEVRILEVDPPKGQPPKARSQSFVLDEKSIAGMARFCADRSREGWNVYVPPNPRKASAPFAKAARAEDVEAATFCFADLDHDRAQEMLRAAVEGGLPLYRVVVTGTTPHLRAHVYFRLDTPSRNFEAWTAQQRGLQAYFDGDPVIDPPRIMRCPGTINWPAPHKAARGYVPELVRFAKKGCEGELVEMEDLAEIAPPVWEAHAPARPDRDPSRPHPNLPTHEGLRVEEMIADLQDGNVNNTIWAVIGHWVRRGWRDFEILAFAPHFTLPGKDVGEIETVMRGMLERTRVKFRVPNPELGVDGEVVAWDAPIEPAAELVPSAARLVDPATIPPREWLYGVVLVRRYVSMLVSPGGTGKTALAMTIALALAANRRLLDQSPHAQAKVWVMNLEDPVDEIERRLAAAMMHHRVKPEEVKGQLFLDSGRDKGICVAQQSREGITVTPDVERLEAAIKKAGIGLLIVDPFVRAHGIEENDNMGQDFAARQFAIVAERTGCAVLLVHHTKKGAAVAGNAEAARGGSAMVAAARAVFTLATMTEQEADALGVDPAERRALVRFDDAKANLAPAAERTAWYRLASVQLGNATEAYPSGDSVQAVEVWSPPNPFDLISAHQIDKVLRAIDAAPDDRLFINHHKAAPERCAAHLIAAEAGIGLDDARRILKTWVEEDVLREVEFRDQASRKGKKSGLRSNPAKRPCQRFQ